MRGHVVKLSFGETEMRRLSPGDFDHIMDILDAVLDGAAQRVNLFNLTVNSASSLAIVMLAGIRSARKPIRAFLVSLLPEEDRDKLSFADVGTLIAAAPHHPDVLLFLDSARPVLQSPLAEFVKSKMTPAETAPESST